MLQTQLTHGDDLVFQAQLLMQESMARPLNMDEIANRLQVSQRTLVRRFQQATGEGPLAYAQKVRVETA